MGQDVPGWKRTGQIIKFYRDLDGITQQQLADMIGVKRSMLSHMENGLRGMKKEYASRLGNVLKCGPEPFMSEIELAERHLLLFRKLHRAIERGQSSEGTLDHIETALDILLDR